MKVTVKERLILFLNHKEISQNKFENLLNFSNGFVNNIRQSIIPDKLQQIALQFPELNIEWLLIGNGEMLKKNNENKADTPFVESVTVKDLIEEIKILSAENAVLKYKLALLSADDNRAK